MYSSDPRFHVEDPSSKPPVPTPKATPTESEPNLFDPVSIVNLSLPSSNSPTLKVTVTRAEGPQFRTIPVCLNNGTRLLVTLYQETDPEDFEKTIQDTLQAAFDKNNTIFSKHCLVELNEANQELLFRQTSPSTAEAASPSSPSVVLENKTCQAFYTTYVTSKKVQTFALPLYAQFAESQPHLKAYTSHTPTSTNTSETPQPEEKRSTPPVDAKITVKVTQDQHKSS